MITCGLLSALVYFAFLNQRTIFWSLKDLFQANYLYLLQMSAMGALGGVIGAAAYGRKTAMSKTLAHACVLLGIALPLVGCAEESPPASDPAAAVVPVLLRPERDRALANVPLGKSTESCEWVFAWCEVPGAKRYQVEITQGVPKPLTMIAQEVTVPRFTLTHSKTVEELSDWRWRVRASVDGEWLAWSDQAKFYVESPDTVEMQRTSAEIKDNTQRDVQKQAIERHRHLGPSAKALAPALADVLSDPMVRPDVFKSLEQLGPEAEPAVGTLTRLIETEDDAITTMSAARTLLAIGTGTRSASPALVGIVTNPKHYLMTRVVVAGALIRGGADFQPVMPFLVEVIGNDPHGGICKMAAVGLLREAGPGARDAVPALLNVLKTEKEGTDTYCNAIIALGNIGPEASAAVPALETALHRGGYSGPKYAGEALHKITGRKH